MKKNSPFEVHHTCVHSSQYNFACGKCIEKEIVRAKQEERESLRAIIKSKMIKDPKSFVDSAWNLPHEDILLSLDQKLP